MRPAHEQHRPALLALLGLPQETTDAEIFSAAYRRYHQPAQPHICEGYARQGFEEYEKGGDLPYWFERIREEAVRVHG